MIPSITSIKSRIDRNLHTPSVLVLVGEFFQVRQANIPTTTEVLAHTGPQAVVGYYTPGVSCADLEEDIVYFLETEEPSCAYVS